MGTGPGPRPVWWRRPTVLVATVLLALAAVLSGLAGTTRPFTSAADAVTATGIAAVTVVAVVAVRRGPERRAAAGSARSWYLVAAAGVLWELAVYFAGWSGRRAEFPTLSSLGDDLGRWPAGRAAMFLVWLLLGWGLFWNRLPRRPGRSRRMVR